MDQYPINLFRELKFTGAPSEDQIKALETSIRSLSERQGKIIFLYYKDGMSQKEIAEAIQASRSSVNVSLRNGIVRLYDFRDFIWQGYDARKKAREQASLQRMQEEERQNKRQERYVNFWDTDIRTVLGDDATPEMLKAIGVRTCGDLLSYLYNTRKKDVKAALPVNLDPFLAAAERAGASVTATHGAYYRIRKTKKDIIEQAEPLDLSMYGVPKVSRQERVLSILGQDDNLAKLFAEHGPIIEMFLKDRCGIDFGPHEDFSIESAKEWLDEKARVRQTIIQKEK